MKKIWISVVMLFTVTVFIFSENIGLLNAVDISAPRSGTNFLTIAPKNASVTSLQIKKALDNTLSRNGFSENSSNPDFYVVFSADVQFAQYQEVAPSGSAIGLSLLANILGAYGNAKSAYGGGASNYQPSSPKGKTIALYAKYLQITFYRPSQNQEDYSNGNATIWQATSAVLGPETDIVEVIESLLSVIFSSYPHDATNEKVSF